MPSAISKKSSSPTFTEIIRSNKITSSLSTKSLFGLDVRGIYHKEVQNLCEALDLETGKKLENKELDDVPRSKWQLLSKFTDCHVFFELLEELFEKDSGDYKILSTLKKFNQGKAFSISDLSYIKKNIVELEREFLSLLQIKSSHQEKNDSNISSVFSSSGLDDLDIEINEALNRVRSKYNDVIENITLNHTSKIKFHGKSDSSLISFFNKFRIKVPIDKDFLDFYLTKKAIAGDPLFEMKLATSVYRILYNFSDSYRFFSSLGFIGKTLLACLECRTYFLGLKDSPRIIPNSAIFFFKIIGVRPEFLRLIRKNESKNIEKNVTTYSSISAYYVEEELNKIQQNANEDESNYCDKVRTLLFGSTKDGSGKNGFTSSAWSELKKNWNLPLEKYFSNHNLSSVSLLNGSEPGERVRLKSYLAASFKNIDTFFSLQTSKNAPQLIEKDFVTKGNISEQRLNELRKKPKNRDDFFKLLIEGVSNKNKDIFNKFVSLREIDLTVFSLQELASCLLSKPLNENPRLTKKTFDLFGIVRSITDYKFELNNFIGSQSPSLDKILSKSLSNSRKINFQVLSFLYLYLNKTETENRTTAHISSALERFLNNDFYSWKTANQDFYKLLITASHAPNIIESILRFTFIDGKSLYSVLEDEMNVSNLSFTDLNDSFWNKFKSYISDKNFFIFDREQGAFKSFQRWLGEKHHDILNQCFNTVLKSDSFASSDFPTHFNNVFNEFIFSGALAPDSFFSDIISLVKKSLISSSSHSITPSQLEDIFSSVLSALKAYCLSTSLLLKKYLIPENGNTQNINQAITQDFFKNSYFVSAVLRENEFYSQLQGFNGSMEQGAELVAPNDYVRSVHQFYHYPETSFVPSSEYQYLSAWKVIVEKLNNKFPVEIGESALKFKNFILNYQDNFLVLPRSDFFIKVISEVIELKSSQDQGLNNERISKEPFFQSEMSGILFGLQSLNFFVNEFSKKPSLFSFHKFQFYFSSLVERLVALSTSMKTKSVFLPKAYLEQIKKLIDAIALFFPLNDNIKSFSNQHDFFQDWGLLSLPSENDSTTPLFLSMKEIFGKLVQSYVSNKNPSTNESSEPKDIYSVFNLSEQLNDFDANYHKLQEKFLKLSEFSVDSKNLPTILNKCRNQFIDFSFQFSSLKSKYLVYNSLSILCDGDLSLVEEIFKFIFDTNIEDVFKSLALLQSSFKKFEETINCWFCVQVAAAFFKKIDIFQKVSTNFNTIIRNVPEHLAVFGDIDSIFNSFIYNLLSNPLITGYFYRHNLLNVTMEKLAKSFDKKFQQRGGVSNRPLFFLEFQNNLVKIADFLSSNVKQLSENFSEIFSYDFFWSHIRQKNEGFNLLNIDAAIKSLKDSLTQLPDLHENKDDISFAYVPHKNKVYIAYKGVAIVAEENNFLEISEKIRSVKEKHNYRETLISKLKYKLENYGSIRPDTVDIQNMTEYDVYRSENLNLAIKDGGLVCKYKNLYTFPIIYNVDDQSLSVNMSNAVGVETSIFIGRVNAHTAVSARDILDACKMIAKWHSYDNKKKRIGSFQFVIDLKKENLLILFNKILNSISGFSALREMLCSMASNQDAVAKFLMVPTEQINFLNNLSIDLEKKFSTVKDWTEFVNNFFFCSAHVFNFYARLEQFQIANDSYTIDFRSWLGPSFIFSMELFLNLYLVPNSPNPVSKFDEVKHAICVFEEGSFLFTSNAKHKFVTSRSNDFQLPSSFQFIVPGEQQVVKSSSSTSSQQK